MNKVLEERSANDHLCHACRIRKQDWLGSPPECAFPHNGEFQATNWNCETASKIREIVYEGQELPPWINYQYCDDQKYTTINIDDLGDELLDHPLALWVSWYKNRGGTDAMWLLYEDRPPTRPTASQCEVIVHWHKERLRREREKRDTANTQNASI